MTFFIVPDGKKFLQDAKKQLAEDGVPDVCALTIWKQDPPPPNKQTKDRSPPLKSGQQIPRSFLPHVYFLLNKSER